MCIYNLFSAVRKWQGSDTLEAVNCQLSLAVMFKFANKGNVFSLWLCSFLVLSYICIDMAIRGQKHHCVSS